MRVICTRTGDCRRHHPIDKEPLWECQDCRFYTRISEPIEVEDVPSKQASEHVEDPPIRFNLTAQEWEGAFWRLHKVACEAIDKAEDQTDLVDSLIAAFEELAGELRFWQESGLYPLGISPGPGWYWVKGHWRSRTAPEARASQAPTGDKDGEPGESPASLQGQPEPFSDGVTVWYCEGCGKPTDIYPCRVCDCWPRLSPEAAELVRQGLEDCAEGRVSEVGHRYGSLGEESENPYPAQTEERSE